MQFAGGKFKAVGRAMADARRGSRSQTNRRRRIRTIEVKVEREVCASSRSIHLCSKCWRPVGFAPDRTHTSDPHLSFSRSPSATALESVPSLDAGQLSSRPRP